MDMPLGIYIHIPFCRSKCNYCDFVSYAGKDHYQPVYREALLKEIQLRARILPADYPKIFSSLFFGGGTPSHLPAEEITAILNQIFHCFAPVEGVEITLEANPESLDSLQNLERYLEAGINRLSIGSQSFDDALLKKMNRPHRSEDIRQAVALARKAGFNNISLDLIYGYPGQTLDLWKNSLEEALNCNPQHLSLYGLTVEGGVPLEKQLDAGEVSLPDEETTISMYEYAMERLLKSGFDHYEISNWAKPGLACRHNLNYWKYGDYLGLGVNAHSYFQGRRYWNLNTLDTYLESLTKNQLPIAGEETIHGKELMAEYCMVTLRLQEGINKNSFKKRFQADIMEMFGNVFQPYIEMGCLDIDHTIIRLTRKGILISDALFADLLAEE
jgi:oxygen-independent coproporphyrinogen-3 oxidase